MTKCQGLMGLIFGHNFVGNYNSEPVPMDIKLPPVFDDFYKVEMMKAVDFNKETYVNSVCTRCGEIIPKDPAALIK